jgi:hypothetical protein
MSWVRRVSRPSWSSARSTLAEPWSWVRNIAAASGLMVDPG